MNWKALQLSSLLTLFLYPVISAAASDGSSEARDWLQRMMNASQELNYEGTFVYIQGQKLESMHIVHSHDEQGERQRLSSLNGSLREVLVVGDSVLCLLPTQEVYVAGSRLTRSPLPVSLPRDLNQLEGYYRFEMLGKDRTAGVDTEVIGIKPRDEFRFGYRLWLDGNTGMVLRSALLDENGYILEQMMFTSIEVKAEIDRELLSPPEGLGQARQLRDHPSGEVVTEPGWSIKSLPRGFMQVLYNRYRKEGGYVTEHIVLTDGLAIVSVFVEELRELAPLLEGPSRMGAINAYGVIKKGHQVMAVGEVPGVTVKMIASSLEPLKASVAQ